MTGLLGDDYGEDLEDLKKLCESTDTVLDAADTAIGEKGSAPEKDRDDRVELKLGQYVAPEVAAVLCKATRNGGITRIQMDDDKRWRWVCREVAAPQRPVRAEGVIRTAIGYHAFAVAAVARE